MLLEKGLYTFSVLLPVICSEANFSINNNGHNRTISYIYDATGVKLKKTVSTGTSTEYAGNYVYEDAGSGSSLKFFNHPEGYVDASGSGYEYVYQYKDHLGNVRAVVQRSGSNAVALVATDYYPGGMAMPGRNIVGDYRYNYQGQELDEETGKVAFQLRLYDPRINRWLTTDPAGQYASPYLSMGNNWINRVDPDGGFDTKLGAWLYRFFNGGGGEIFQNENGDWGISRTYFDEEAGVDGLEMTFGWNWERNFRANVPDSGFSEHFNQAILWEDWVAKYSGMSKSQITRERGGSQLAPNGPESRYVLDPQDPMKVIDMRHMLIVGQYDWRAGTGIEVSQLIGGHTDSAFDKQDFYSNIMGNKFYQGFVVNTATTLFEGAERGQYMAYMLTSGFVSELNRFMVHENRHQFKPLPSSRLQLLGN